jgi:hypothetical protein
VVDVVVRKGVERTMADRIEANTLGSHAHVSISSFPFSGYLAVAGRVPALRVDVTGVTVEGLRFESIELKVEDLEVDRGRLEHGQVQVRSIRVGTVVADISQSALDAYAHLPVTLGQGTVGVAGVTAAAHATIAAGEIRVALSNGLASIKVPVPDLDILPCVGSAQIRPGVLRLSCTFRTVPSFLAHTTFS